MCQHLLGTEGQDGVVRFLTGIRLEYDLCCAECARTAQHRKDVVLFEACEGCVARCTDGWEFTWRGEPGIEDRPGVISHMIEEARLPARTADLAPAHGEGGSVWLLLTADGDIGRFDADSGDWRILARASVPREPDRRPWAGHELRRRLHASPRGNFAAVVNDYGRHGQVIDLRTGVVTLTLDGGTYHPETVPFSLAFTEYESGTAVVHRTAWNRLDISDAATGELLSARGPTSYRKGEQRPEHYLDYFHGALHVSPDNGWIADDGWVWSPVGVPRAWSLRRWLEVNSWEAEDGPSLWRLCQRSYHWDSPMCWVAENLLAIYGIGEDDEALLPGVRVFDVATGAEVFAFALTRPASDLFSEGNRLYAAGKTGMDVWDPATGERTGTVLGFVPTVHHPSARELAAFDGDNRILQLWPTAPSSPS